MACIWQWISGDLGALLSVLGEFLGSGGMGCDILSKRDRLPAVGAMGVAAHRTGAVARVGGVGAMCEIDDPDLSGVYGGEYS